MTHNREKCVIGAKSLEYMGEVLTGEGLQISKRRMEAIVDAPKPQNQSQVRSFPGYAQFCAKFPPWIFDNIEPLVGPNVHWQVQEVGYQG